ncbi:MAG: ACT domain-containing protein [Candidatus Omnitrophica bacterium]|nr:ACT domain-containing protein [Candidatus Omnitrophota bacterium]
MAKRWIVTALGKDRPGIVAGVTQVLYKLGCNLEDSAMTRLEGEFAIMLILSGRASVTPEKLRAAFSTLQRRLKLVVYVKPLSRQEATTPRGRGKPFMISVYGSDRPGIVFRVADTLAKAGVNVTDVHTHRSAGKRPSLYLMLLEVEVPSRVKLAALERRLKTLGGSLGVRVNLRPSDTTVL